MSEPNYIIPAAGQTVHVPQPDGSVFCTRVLRRYPHTISRDPRGCDVLVEGARERIPYGRYLLTPPPIGDAEDTPKPAEETTE